MTEIIEEQFSGNVFLNEGMVYLSDDFSKDTGIESPFELDAASLETEMEDCNKKISEFMFLAMQNSHNESVKKGFINHASVNIVKKQILMEVSAQLSDEERYLQEQQLALAR